MLKTVKSISLNGEVRIEEKLVVTLQANITDGTAGSYINQNIIDTDIYKEHKSECRKSILEFHTKVNEIEDELADSLE